MMKKISMMFAAAMVAASVSAQTVDEGKLFDNWYVGAGVGANVKTTHTSWSKNLNPDFSLRAGKWFTPVYGAAVEGTFNFRNRPYGGSKTFFRGAGVGFLGTLNLTNLCAGYEGEPRFFEVIPVAGLGAEWSFGQAKNLKGLTSKAGVDFAFNLGSSKAWQVYVEPSMVWALHNNYECSGIEYNVNKSGFQLNVGVNYKFKNSNGKHYFSGAELRDQVEIDGLNTQINNLRNDLSAKDAELAAKDQLISKLQGQTGKTITTVTASETSTNLQPTVLFRQGKTVVDNSQLGNIELIAQYMKNHPNAVVEIKGYASPEGSKEINEKISSARAAAVKNVLVNKYKISADRLVTKGMGATDKLFKQVEFNRLATFNDNSEK